MQEKIISNLKQWQRVENEFLAATDEILARADHPDVRVAVEAIQTNLRMSQHTQKFIAHSLDSVPFPLTLEELGEIWGIVEKNIQLLGRMIEAAEEILGTAAYNLTRQIPFQRSHPALH